MKKAANYFGLNNAHRSKAWYAGLCFAFLLPSFQLKAQKDTTKLKEVKIISPGLQKAETIVPSQQINAADFKRYSAFTVADAVRNFSGVNIKDYGGIGGLKTISVRSLGANQTAVLYDGIQLSNVQSGQIDLSRFNLEGISEITLYNGQPPFICQPARSFAAASVLSIRPVRPNLTADKPYQVIAGVKGGSFGLINPYLLWQQRLSKQWSLVVNSNWEKANGRYKYKTVGDGSDTTSTRLNADVRALQTDAALYWAKNDSNTFTIRYNYNRQQQGLPGAVVFYNPTTGQRLWNSDSFVQATYNRTWAGGWHLLVNTKGSQDFLHYNDPTFLNAQHNLDQRYHQKELYGSGALSYQITSIWEASFATDYAIAKLNTNSYQYAFPTRSSVLSVLATALTLGNFHLQGDLLHTYIHESVKNGATNGDRSVYSPAIMATWKPNVGSPLMLRAFYKDIFRYPTFDELYYSPIGARNIRPEYAKQYNAGATYSKAYNGFFDNLSLTADAYYNKVKDKIVAIPNQNLFIWSIQNIGKTNIKGIDAGLRTSTHSINGYKFILGLNYTYQNAQIVTDPTASNYLDQIAYTPKNLLSANLGVTYKHAAVYYNHSFTSARYYLNDNDPNYLLPSYSVSDLSASYNLPLYGRQLSLIAELNNLFNTNYQVVRSFPMPGRSIRFTIQITI